MGNIIQGWGLTPIAGPWIAAMVGLRHLWIARATLPPLFWVSIENRFLTDSSLLLFMQPRCDHKFYRKENPLTHLCALFLQFLPFFQVLFPNLHQHKSSSPPQSQ